MIEDIRPGSARKRPSRSAPDGPIGAAPSELVAAAVPPPAKKAKTALVSPEREIVAALDLVVGAVDAADRGAQPAETGEPAEVLVQVRENTRPLRSKSKRATASAAARQDTLESAADNAVEVRGQEAGKEKGEEVAEEEQEDEDMDESDRDDDDDDDDFVDAASHTGRSRRSPSQATSTATAEASEDASSPKGKGKGKGKANNAKPPRVVRPKAQKPVAPPVVTFTHISQALAQSPQSVNPSQQTINISSTLAHSAAKTRFDGSWVSENDRFESFMDEVVNQMSIMSRRLDVLETHHFNFTTSLADTRSSVTMLQNTVHHMTGKGPYSTPLAPTSSSSSFAPTAPIAGPSSLLSLVLPPLQSNPVSDEADLESAGKMANMLQKFHQEQSQGASAAGSSVKVGNRTDPGLSVMGYNRILAQVQGGKQARGSATGSGSLFLPRAEDEEDEEELDQLAPLHPHDHIVGDRMDPLFPVVSQIDSGLNAIASSSKATFKKKVKVEAPAGTVVRKGRKPELSRVVRATMFKLLGLPVVVGSKYHGYKTSPSLPEFSAVVAFDPTTGARIWRWEWDKTLRQSPHNAAFGTAIINQITAERTVGGLHTDVPPGDWASIEDALESAYTNLRRERDAQVDPAKRHKKDIHRKRGKKRGLKEDKCRRRLEALEEKTIREAADSTPAPGADYYVYTVADTLASTSAGGGGEEDVKVVDYKEALHVRYMSSEDEMEQPSTSNNNNNDDPNEEGTPLEDIITCAVGVSLAAGVISKSARSGNLSSRNKMFSLHRPDWRSELLVQFYSELDTLRPPERSHLRSIGAARKGVLPPVDTPGWMVRPETLDLIEQQRLATTRNNLLIVSGPGGSRKKGSGTKQSIKVNKTLARKRAVREAEDELDDGEEDDEDDEAQPGEDEE